MFVFNLNDELVCKLDNDGNGQCPYWSDEITERLNGQLNLTFEIPTQHPDSKLVDVGSLIVFQDTDGTFKELVVTKVEEEFGATEMVKSIECEGSYYKLLEHIVAKVGIVQGNAMTALGRVLNGTPWEVGFVDPNLVYTNKDIAFTMENGLECINKILETWECEAQYRVVVDGGQISHRYVDLYGRRGDYSGVRFTFDNNLTSVTREADFSNVKTRAYGVGKKLFTNKDGTYEWVDFQDMVWSKSKGDPVDKPKGQIYVDNPEAIAKWGIRDGVYTQDTEDIKVLLEETWKALKDVANPKITYKMECRDLSFLAGYEHLKVELGDTIVVIDKSFGIDVATRVMERKWSISSPDEMSLTIGNFQEVITNQVGQLVKHVDDLGIHVSSLPNKDWVGDAVNHATNLITGNLGGYVVFKLNDEGQPEEILVMDTPDITTAKNVWRWNKSGFGHSNNGYGGTYGTAITQDGYIIGDYVRTGSIGSLDGAFKMNLDSGGLLTYSNGYKAMEMSGRELRFYDWDTEVHVGSVYSGRISYDVNRKGIVLGAEKDSFVSLSRRYPDGELYSSILIDNNSVKATPYTINVHDDLNWGSAVQYWWGFQNKDTYASMFLGSDQNLCIGHNHKKAIKLGTYYVGDKLLNPALEITNPNNTQGGWGTYFRHKTGFEKDAVVFGNFTVVGDKNCVQETTHYGSVLYSAYETNEPMLGYPGECTLDEYGKAYIQLSGEFLESVNTKMNYHVTTQIYGNMTVEPRQTTVERHETYFIIHGEPNLQVGFEIKARRRGFETVGYRTDEQRQLQLSSDDVPALIPQEEDIDSVFPQAYYNTTIIEGEIMNDREDC